MGGENSILVVMDERNYEALRRERLCELMFTRECDSRKDKRDFVPPPSDKK